MYDAIAESVPLAQTGQHRKRAIVLISDGNDTDSQASLSEVKQMIRESEVMVYAIGIDGQAEDDVRLPADDARAAAAAADAEPVSRRTAPARSRRRHSSAAAAVPVAVPAGARDGTTRARRGDDRVNVNALREITDDSGGRTEIVRIGPRPRSGDGEHRRRAEPAVLSRLRVDDEERRPLARDSRGNTRQIAARPRAPRLRRHAVARS